MSLVIIAMNLWEQSPVPLKKMFHYISCLMGKNVNLSWRSRSRVQSAQENFHFRFRESEIDFPLSIL